MDLAVPALELVAPGAGADPTSHGPQVAQRKDTAAIGDDAPVSLGVEPGSLEVTST